MLFNVEVIREIRDPKDLGNLVISFPENVNQIFKIYSSNDIIISQMLSHILLVDEDMVLSIIQKYKISNIGYVYLRACEKGLIKVYTYLNGILLNISAISIVIEGAKLACINGHIDIIKEYLEIFDEFPEGLQLAINNYHFDIFKLLFKPKHAMDVLNSIIFNNMIELYTIISPYLPNIPINYLKIAVTLNYTELTELMIDHINYQQNINDYKHLYQIAINNSNSKILKILLDKYIDISDNVYGSILYIPIKNNDYEIFNLLLKYIKNKKDLVKPLSDAINFNRVDMVNSLLKLSIDVNQKDFLSEAVESNNTEIVELLLLNNATVTERAINIAVEKSYFKILNILLELSEFDVNTEISIYKKTPLYLGIMVYNSDINTIRILLQYGADANMDSVKYMYEIIKYDDYDLLKVLIQYIDTIPEEVLIYAINNGRVNLFELLIYPDQHLTKSLTTAIKSNQYKIMIILLDEYIANPLYLNKKNQNYLHVGIINNSDYMIIQKLLTYNIDVNQQDISGNTPIMYIDNISNNLLIIELLITEGANINLLNNNNISFNDKIIMTQDVTLIKTINEYSQNK